ncbi:MAG: peptidyl-prolyl cis-trans isomerase [Novosphingobium sp.]|uniref:peptidylprolyl isomerase n=1 Tax=Novosphingobium sp. TaxID=1874826 RepID=UPI0032BC1160
MISFIRSFFNSKLGVVLAMGFVVLIMFGFAAGDLAGNGGFGAFGKGNRVATIGRQSVSSDDLEKQVGIWLERLRKSNPGFTIKQFIAEDGINKLLSFLIDAKATRLWGESHGIYIGERLIDHEIAKNGRLQGPDGKIDPDLYGQFLAEQGMTDAQFRGEAIELLMARQLLGPSTIGLTVPRKVSMRYAGALTEQRQGAIVTLPLAAFAPKGPLTDAEVQAYYNSHKGDYALPERRTIRWASYSDSAIQNVPAPTDAEVAARYNAGKALYAPTDKRKLTQVVLPTEAAARAVLAEATGGKKLEQVVAAKGLSVAALGSLTKEAFVAQANQSAADAVFAAEAGKTVGPFKVPLGWAIVRVDARETTAGKTLEQATPEITKLLADEKRRNAIIEYSQRIEEEFSNGGSLGDVAKELGLTVVETPLILADGSVFGQNGLNVAPQLAKVVPTVFQLDGPGNPQLAEVEAGKTFVVFDVGQAMPAAPPPLDQIRAQVAEDARIAKGEVAAKAAADKIKAQVESGVPIEVALASLGVTLPPVDRVDTNRQKVEEQGPAAAMPLRLLFAMPKGKVKLLRAPRNRGWYVVTVTQVTPGNVAENDERMTGLSDSLRKAKAEEYTEETRDAFRGEVGSTRDDANVVKLQRQLSGSN